MERVEVQIYQNSLPLNNTSLLPPTTVLEWDLVWTLTGPFQQLKMPLSKPLVSIYEGQNHKLKVLSGYQFLFLQKRLLYLVEFKN